jgi:Protein of unknown function (DUF3099)
MAAEDPDERERPVGEPSARRKRAYFWLMGTCVVLILLAWNVVRLWSPPAAIAMSVVAAVIPPLAAVVANWGRGG